MKYLALILVIISFASCRKAIDVDLNEANPVTVIEANYTAEDSTVRVLITETSNFFSGDAEPTVDNAVVTITDQAGASQQVPFVTEGWYVLENYIPNYGTTYKMSVLSNGVTYTATCEMKALIPQYPIFYEYTEPGLFNGDGGYIPAITYDDPVEEGNYVSAIITVNDLLLSDLNELTLNDDQFTNGNLVVRPLFGTFFDIGDSVSIEMRTIDKKVYDYYTELISLTDPNSAAPANPDYQWENRALGYFSAHPSSRQWVIIQ
jgi:hypothetical protein